eukprot:gene14115-18939_t
MNFVKYLEETDEGEEQNNTILAEKSLDFYLKSDLPQVRKYFDQSRINSSVKLPMNAEFQEIITNKNGIKCYSVSDIHVDHTRNMTWFHDNCLRKPEDSNVFTILMLPGDVGTLISHLKMIFLTAIANYDAVCYVPGNHEAYTRGSATTPPASNSIEKLSEIFNLGKECGIHMGPLRVQLQSSIDEKGLVLFPLHSWYHASWDTEADIQHPTYLQAEQFFPFSSKWTDFICCEWPNDMISKKEFICTNNNHTADNTILAEAFASINERFLFPIPSNDIILTNKNEHNDVDYKLIGSPIAKEGDTIISFSHFLPRQELCPEKRFIMEPLLTRVIGSDPLEAQIRRLKPHVHIFGHTHIPIDLDIDDVRYIQWPLGYFRESNMQCAPIYNSGALLIYDSSLGHGIASFPTESSIRSKNTKWANYYRNNHRNPLNTMELAPWVLQRFENVISNT